MHLKDFIFGTEVKWKFFVRYWIGIYLQKYNSSCDSNSGPHAAPNLIPQFYKDTLDAITWFMTLIWILVWSQPLVNQFIGH